LVPSRHGTHSTRLFSREVKEVAGKIDHAGGFIHYHHAAGTHDRAGRLERVVVHRDVQEMGRNASAGRTAGLHGLERPVVERAAADVEDHFPQADSQGDFDQPRPFHLAHQGEGLGALAGFRPHLGEPGGAVLQDHGDAGQRFHVVDDRGALPEAGDGGKGRPRAGHSPFAFDRSDQCGLLAANERAGPFLDLDLEIEARAEDVVAQQAAFFRLPQRDSQPLQGQRVFRAAIDVTLAGADGVSGDGHAFQQRVGVALQERAIHEGPGIALVGIADQILLVAGRLPAELPLAPGGKAGAAPASQTRLFDLVDDPLRTHRQRRRQALVAVLGEVVIDLGGVDEAAIPQRPADLRLEDRRFQKRWNSIYGRVAVSSGGVGPQGELGQGIVAEQVALEDLFGPLDVDFAVKDARSRRLDHADHRLGVTEADAAHFDQTALEIMFFAELPEAFQDFHGPRRSAASGRAHENPRLVAGFQGAIFFLGPSPQVLKIPRHRQPPFGRAWRPSVGSAWLRPCCSS
jgi:hypothetical protein